ncbi:MAG: hypothetical protein LC624_05900 [Halobacteriales archaeon]|nr:hypothetical protein [Halobacteriales archaeon]
MRSMRVALLLGVVALAPLAGAAALPSVPVVLALPGAWLTQYATPAMVVQPGGALGFWNLDVMYHDVVSHELGPAGQAWCMNFQVGHCPLFWSRLANLNEQVPVLGLENAVPGAQYSFYCTKHNDSMQGTLVVLPA